jgi:hypothetical protein
MGNTCAFSICTNLIFYRRWAKWCACKGEGEGFFAKWPNPSAPQFLIRLVAWREHSSKVPTAPTGLCNNLGLDPIWTVHQNTRNNTAIVLWWHPTNSSDRDTRRSWNSGTCSICSWLFPTVECNLTVWPLYHSCRHVQLPYGQIWETIMLVCWSTWDIIMQWTVSHYPNSSEALSGIANNSICCQFHIISSILPRKRGKNVKK